MLIEAAVITASSFILAALPVFWPRIRGYSASLLVFGTGALFGICIFDLLPDLYHLGGKFALLLMLGAWVIYSLAHVLPSHGHSRDHNHDYIEEHIGAHDSKSAYIFLIAITAHVFANGLLLGVSNQLSKHMAESVFTALFVHKIYESIAVSALLLSFNRSKAWTVSMLGIYLVAFPLAVGVATFLGQINHAVLLVISGIAVGSLAGCLVFDFIVPSLQHIRKSNRQLIWLVLGFLLTVVLIH